MSDSETKLTTKYCKVTGIGVIYKGIHESEWIPSIRGCKKYIILAYKLVVLICLYSFAIHFDLWMVQTYFSVCR